MQLYRRIFYLELYLTALLTLAAFGVASAQNAKPTLLGDSEIPEAVQRLCRIEAASKYDIAVGHFCTKLQRAWHDPYGMLQGQQLVLDFGAFREGHPSARPAHLSGDFLSRALSTPNLLPEWVPGGIAIRAITIEGQVQLHNTTLPFPVTLEDVKLIGPSNRQADTVLSLFNAHIKRITILNAHQIMGNISVRASTIEEGFFIKDSRLGRSPLKDLAIRYSSVVNPGNTAIGIEDTVINGTIEIVSTSIESPEESAIYIRESEVQGDILLLNIAARGMVKLEGNDVSDLKVSGAAFSGGLQVNDNSARLIEIKTEKLLAIPVKIQDNSVHGYMKIHNDKATVGNKRGDLNFAVTKNTIHGDLRIKTTNAPIRAERAAAQANWKVSSYVDRIDLSYNVVDGDFDVEVPQRIQDRPWYRRQEVSVVGSRVKGRLIIASAGCEARNGEKKLIALTNVDVSGLAWNIAPECAMPWRGGGLRFRQWGNAYETGENGTYRTAGGGGKGNQIVEWANNEINEDPETRHFLAQFLLQKGYVDQGRDLLQSAKEIAYAPDRRGDGGVAIRALDYVTWLYLLPTGYGAKPERALVVLFVVWFIGLCIYGGYYQACKAHRIRAQNSHLPGLWIEGWSDLGRAFKVEPSRKGASEVDGFNQFDDTKLPKSFSIVAFATDAMLPFINLHAYSLFYPEHPFPRFVSFVQHFFGWWMVTSFVAAAAVL